MRLWKDLFGKVKKSSEASLNRGTEEEIYHELSVLQSSDSSYTIGPMIIFPKHQNSINQRRGTNQYICDRGDLTLECIRRWYGGEESPLSGILDSDADFFKLFVSFKEYVDYFFLQDCVTDDYSKVKIWYGKGDFSEIYPMPKTVEEYLKWIDDQKEFVQLRNRRNDDFVNLVG